MLPWPRESTWYSSQLHLTTDMSRFPHPSLHPVVSDDTLDGYHPGWIQDPVGHSTRDVVLYVKCRVTSLRSTGWNRSGNHSKGPRSWEVYRKLGMSYHTWGRRWIHHTTTRVVHVCSSSLVPLTIPGTKFIFFIFLTVHTSGRPVVRWIHRTTTRPVHVWSRLARLKAKDEGCTRLTYTVWHEEP